MFQKHICLIISLCLLPLPQVHANEMVLPVPGKMVQLSAAYQPAILKGLTVHKDNPFMFDFLVDVGQDKLQGEALKQEGDKFIQYFLATLAVPEKDLWVNLSPYEKNRTVPQALGQTALGSDLLAQDYILKQLTASLIYPEKELGKKFWDNVYQKTQAKYGKVNIPVNTFNKVWIMADKAEVYEHNQTAFVTDTHLKVMLEEDYLAANKNTVETRFIASQTSNKTTQNIIKASEASLLSNKVLQEIILPEIEHEINTGKNFATLRQIFNAIILATWYKNNLKQSLLNDVYSNQNKVKGIDLQDQTINQEIYERYVQAYKKGVFNYVKDGAQPKKYFSGGVVGRVPLTTINKAMASQKAIDDPVHQIVSFKVRLNDAAMTTSEAIVELMDMLVSNDVVDDQIMDDIAVYLIRLYRSHKDKLEILFPQLIVHPNYKHLKNKIQALYVATGYPTNEMGKISKALVDFNCWHYCWNNLLSLERQRKFFYNKAMASTVKGKGLLKILSAGVGMAVASYFIPEDGHKFLFLYAGLGVTASGWLLWHALNAPKADEAANDSRFNQDQAMNGGIDFKDSALKTKLRKDGLGVSFAVDSEFIERVKRDGLEGLTPVIVHIEPVINIAPLLGLPVKNKS